MKIKKGSNDVLLVTPDYGKDEARYASKSANEFLQEFRTYETQNNIPNLLMYDKKSEAFYIVCHIDGLSIVNYSDLQAVLDPSDSEDYKLNRDLYTDTQAFQLMEEDAIKGRSFEDIVVEYDRTYRKTKPLKVFGGQHRINAISSAVKSNVNSIHGIRVYFNLSLEQKVNIAMVNNTSITVPNDLLDRMQEELLGSDLRNWCQRIGLLDEKQNFADKRSQDGIPTVRIARTLLINYFKGKVANLDDFHRPVVCTSGSGLDPEYKKIRSQIDWKDKDLEGMGKEFTKLHKTQKKIVSERNNENHSEFANKALHPSVVASWAYAAGLFQSNNDYLRNHYDLVKASSHTKDPLNAKALVTARLKGVDPETYRGLGSRINQEEFGRMLEVFILQSTTAKKRGITKDLANAAIQTYYAKKQNFEAEKAVKKI
ncbi:hypothetical protein POF51_07720 [Brevibacillus sp. AG]|uniref:hypothetical protein n=1 Tax=Brevibacillus sp. AG TaxID=3020891 RepID=UPI00232ED131|nr:hypothetical protein [Brevibacillus sp. AG]MDC0760574.1 hypothetical protein [Brevibacillus sp. AG]